MQVPQLASIEVVLERLNAVRDNVTDIKDTVIEIEKRQHAMIIAAAKVEDHEKRIAEVEKKVEMLWSSVQPVILMSKILGVVGTILAGSVIALIWSILTHQITFIIP